MSAQSLFEGASTRIPRHAGVYLLYCAPEGKAYIGSTHLLRVRYNTHTRKLRRKIHENPGLQAAWLAHGGAQIRFRVLEELPSLGGPEDEAARVERENFWMSQVPREQLYNTTIPATVSGRTTPLPHTRSSGRRRALRIHPPRAAR